MYSKLLRVSIPPSSTPPLSSPRPSSSNSSAGLQLQFELASAAEKAMVSTRSQDHTPARGLKDEALKSSRSTSARGMKRHAQFDEHVATPTEPASKRRRGTEKLKSDTHSTIEATGIKDVEIAQQSDERPDNVRVEVVVRPDVIPVVDFVTDDSASPSPQCIDANGSNEHIDDYVPEMVSTEISQDHNDLPVAAENVELNISQPSSKSAKRRKPNKATQHPAENAKDATEAPTENPMSIMDSTPQAIPTAKATHKRFNSEEPNIPNPLPEIQPSAEPKPKDPEPPPNDSSDDEAPEQVTASAAQDQARAQALEETQAATALKKERKLKRKERDERLKSQAEVARNNSKTKPSSKIKKSKLDAVETIEPENLPASPPTAQPPKAHKLPLPALLPSHLLTDEPTPRPLLPPPPPTKANPSQKKRFQDLEQRPPKDIKKSGMKIRVLQEQSGILPPKANKASRNLREAWLMGVRGKGMGIERRKMGLGGFGRR